MTTWAVEARGFIIALACFMGSQRSAALGGASGAIALQVGAGRRAVVHRTWARKLNRAVLALSGVGAA